MSHDELHTAWQAVTAELGEDSLSGQQRAWLAVTQPLGLFEDTVIIAAPHQFAREAFESRLRSVLTDALTRQLGRNVQIAVTVKATPPADTAPKQRQTPAQAPKSQHESVQEAPAHQSARDFAHPAPDTTTHGAESAYQGRHVSPQPDTPPADPPQQPDFNQQPDPLPQQGQKSGIPALFDTSSFHSSASGTTYRNPGAPRVPHARGSGPLVSPPPSSDPAPDRTGAPKPEPRQQLQPPVATAANRLNPKYSFDTFVIGSSNRFAHAAAVAVAESPAKAYNPLFIYGGSGLGKTHLVHAIGHYAQNLGNANSVRYVSTEEFTNDFINSLRDDKRQAFQRRYRDVDILLIDDIQFLERAERTQEEFFHTFNTLHNSNKQLVITSDRSPKQLSTLEDRLRTRFEWGLLADIQPPDLETRIAILRKKAAQERLDAPTDALEFIASRINHSIRELEGALIRVTAYASLTRKPVDLGLAQEVLRDFIPEGETPDITTEGIMAATADYFGVSDADLRGHSRSRVLVNARQVAMYLCRELTDLSLPRIGQAFGGRDHTTVMHSDRKIRKQMAEKRSLYNQIAELTNRLKQQGD